MLDKLTKTLRLRLNAVPKASSASVELAPPAPSEQHLARAFLRLTSRDGLVTLQADFAPEPMLKLVGSLTGTASSVQSQVGDRPASVISFPIDALRVQVTAAFTQTPTADYQLVRATHRRIPEGQAVEVVYAHGDLQARYLVELPPGVEVTGFKDFCRTRPVFEEVPPVAQMVAFLKATIHQRRTTLRSLATMARRASEKSVSTMVAAMEEQLSGGHDFDNPGIRLARAVLEAHGRTVYPNTVAALCVLCDIYLGHLKLQEVIDGKYETSAEAVRAAVEFLGVRGSSKLWRELRPAGLSAPRWRESSNAARFLQATLGRRTALTILQDLAEDSGSERSRDRVVRLLARVPQDQVLVNDEHLALHAYLAARGRTIQTETIAAMGIYVDFEAGILSVEDIDSLTPQRGFWDTSLYGMLAICGAFDRELKGFFLGGRGSRRWGYLARLVSLAEGGAVARFLEKGQPGYTTIFLADGAAVDAARRQGLRFSGEVLASLPTLDYLHEPDLAELLKAGEVMACFGSDDRHVQWRRISGAFARTEATEELLRGEYSFIDGYRVYHFLHSVLGRLTAGSGAVAVFRDQRGNAHYQFGEGTPQHGWEPSEEAVELPDLEALPRSFQELTHDHLLGRPEKHTVEQSRLDWILTGVRQLLTEPWSYRRLADYSSQLARVQEQLASTSLAAVLGSVVEDREAAVSRLDLDSVEVAEPLLEALGAPEASEFATLALLYDGSERFRELLLDRLYALAEGEHRGLACLLLGSAVLAGDSERQLAARYVLARSLDADRPEAARTLAALALDEIEPLKPLARTPGAEPPSQEPRDELDYGALSRELATFFNLPGDYEAPVRTMLVGLFTGAEPAEAEAQAEEVLSPLELKLQASERALFEAEQRLISLTRQVHDDPVTGLPGALVIELALKYAVVPSAAVVMRLQGDEAFLRDATSAMARVLGGLLGRTGPDEFTAVVPSTDALELAVLVARLREAAGQPLAFGVDVGGRLEEARRALEAGLEAGQELRFSDEALHSLAASLEYELWRGLDAAEFALYYQPVVELATRRVVGFEALLRWQHPQRGLLLPDDFLSVATRTGVLGALAGWQTEQASSLAARHPEVWFSVNGLAVPGCVVELPCSAALPEGRVAWEGPGFPPAGGEFFKFFLGELSTAFACVTLARSLGLEPIAVGVETPEQLAFLRGVNCRLGQGFLFSEAVPRARVPELIC